MSGPVKSESGRRGGDFALPCHKDRTSWGENQCRRSQSTWPGHGQCGVDWEGALIASRKVLFEGVFVDFAHPSVYLRNDSTTMNRPNREIHTILSLIRPMRQRRFLAVAVMLHLTFSHLANAQDIPYAEYRTPGRMILEVLKDKT